MVRRFPCLIYLIVFGLGCGMVLPKGSFAATEAYYRFEPGGLLLDSSGNGRHLIVNQRNDGGAAPGVSLPSGFPTVVPVTEGVANTQAIQVNPDTSTPLDNGYLATADDEIFSSTSFTIEAFIRAVNTASGTTQALVGQWNSPINQRGWLLSLSSKTLKIQVSGNGVNNAEVTNFTLEPDVDYYVGGSLHFQTDIGPLGQDLVARLYLRDLTNNGPLLTSQFYMASPSGLNNPPYGLSIGSTTVPAPTLGGAHFAGIIDEVRFSTGVLDPTQLLGYAPNAGVVSPPTIRGSYVPSGPLNRVDVTLNGDQLTSYTPADLLPATLVDFKSYGALNSQRADILMPAGSTEPAPLEARAGLLGDLMMNTGFIDVESWTVNFAENIVNRPGPDIVLVDFGSPDSINVTIGEITKTGVFATTTSAGAHLPDLTHFLSASGIPVTTLAELEAATFPDPPAVTAGNTNMYGIDLSDFGFAEGASLTAGTNVIFFGGTTIDPVEVLGLKEPVTNIPGDFDGDGVVDGQDFLLWQRGASTNGNMDLTDLANWRDNYGVGAVAAATPIPEPSGLALLLLGNLIGISRLRKVLFS